MPSYIHETMLLDEVEEECKRRGFLVSRPLKIEHGIIDLFAYDPIHKISTVFEAYSTIPNLKSLEEKVKKYSHIGDVIFVLPEACRKNMDNLTGFNFKFVIQREFVVDEKLKHGAKKFDVLANIHRLRMLMLLSRKPRQYHELQGFLGLTTGDVAYHLKLLARQDLVTKNNNHYVLTKEGNEILELLSCFFELPYFQKEEATIKKRKPLTFKLWNEQELAFLRQNYGKLTIKQIAKELGRTFASIMGKAKVLGLMTTTQDWSQEEVQYLQENYGRIPTSEIMANLGRNPFSIYVKANKLGLKARY